MKKEIETNKSVKNNVNKGMKNEFKKIVEEGKEVEIDGNRIRFFKASEEIHTYSFLMPNDNTNNINNTTETNNTESQSRYGLEITCGKEIDRRINLKNHIFSNFRFFELNEDLSIRTIEYTRSIRMDYGEEEKSFEGIYLSEFIYPIDIHSQNFYTFDKEQNITGVKQQITFKANHYYIDENFDKQVKNMSEDEKMKFNLLKMIKEISKEKHVYGDFYLTFKGNNANVLIDNKLYFFEKKNKEYELINIINNIAAKKDDSISVVLGLTASEDKVFVEYVYENKVEKDDGDHEYIRENVLRIKVFDQKTRQLKTTLALPSDQHTDCFGYNFNYLINKINYKEDLNKENFDKKLKEYFDKHAKITDNKKSVKKEVKENLNKINEINDNNIQKGGGG